MAIGFFFTSQGKTLQLPVNPSELKVVRESGNHRVEVVSLGDINLLRGAKLARVDLEFLLPGEDYAFTSGPWKSPEEYVRLFRGAMENRRSLRFVVSDLDVNMKVSVESFDAVRSAGDHDSINCRLSLLQYRSYGADVLEDGPYQSQFSRKTTRTVDKPQSTSHTVKSGESFWAIAQKELGDGSRYGEIASLNGLSANAIIHPGQTLKLPGR